MATLPAPLAGRYRFSRRVQAGTRTIAWLAIDEQTGREVVASPLTGPRFSGLLRALGVSHPHLCSIVDLIKDPDPDSIPQVDTTTRIAAVGIAEYLPGRTLHEELKGGPLDLETAVTSLLHVCEAVGELHRAGAVHGAISPRSIVVAPTEARVSPVLTQLIAPTSGAYSAPERLKGHGPSTEDDVWALYATLHATLVAGVPFSGTTREELVDNMMAGKLHQLSEFAIDAPDLQALLTQGMIAPRMERQSDVGKLVELLREWMQTHGFGERDSVVSTREEIAVTHTEPPVPVYEDEDQTRVYVRPGSGLISAALWSIPDNTAPRVPGIPDAEEPEPEQPSAPPAVAPALEHKPASPSTFPVPRPRRPRLQSIHLDPFTLAGFQEPTQPEETQTKVDEPSDAAAEPAPTATAAATVEAPPAPDAPKTTPAQPKLGKQQATTKSKRKSLEERRQMELELKRRAEEESQPSSLPTVLLIALVLLALLGYWTFVR